MRFALRQVVHPPPFIGASGGWLACVNTQGKDGSVVWPMRGHSGKQTGFDGGANREVESAPAVERRPPVLKLNELGPTPGSPSEVVSDPRPPGSLAPQPDRTDRRGDSPLEDGRLGSFRHGYTFRRVLLTADMLGLAVAITAADLALASAGRGGLAIEPFLVSIGFVPAWLFLAVAVGLYHLPERRIDHNFVDELAPVFLVTTVWSWLYVIATAAIVHGPTELLGPSVLWMATIVAVLTARAIARRLARSRSWYRRRVLLIGDREGTDRVHERVLRHPEWGLDVISRLRIEGTQVDLDRLDGASVEPGQRIDGASGEDFADRIAAVTSELGVDRVILTGISTSLSKRTKLARRLTECGQCVDYVYGEPETLYAAAVLHHLEGLPVLSVQPTRLGGGLAAIKRGLDLALSVAGLVLLSPLFAIAAIWIKLDSRGPVFFRQLRVGLHGREFELIKFRTMFDGADERRNDVRERSICGNGHGLLKLEDDPRITRIGSKLRRWSIDELPQLWNVARGDMSLVGPRPLPLDEAPLVNGHFALRMEVRPGITGTWQTSGRSDIPFEDMVKLDYTYVACWSLREDLRLLARTASVIAHGRGTY